MDPKKVREIADLVNKLYYGDEKPFYSLSDHDKVALWEANAEMSDWQIGSCAQAFASLGQWDKALAIANSIASGSERYESLGGIAQILIKAGLLEKAESVINAIPVESGTSENVEAIVRLASAWVEAGKTKEATSLLSKKGVQTAKARKDADCLNDVAYGLAKAGDLEQAIKLWKEVIIIAKEMLDNYPNSQESYLEEVKLLKWIPIACAKFGDYGKAKEFVEMLPEKHKKEVLNKLIEMESE